MANGNGGFNTGDIFGRQPMDDEEQRRILASNQFAAPLVNDPLTQPITPPINDLPPVNLTPQPAQPELPPPAPIAPQPSKTVRSFQQPTKQEAEIMGQRQKLAQEQQRLIQQSADIDEQQAGLMAQRAEEERQLLAQQEKDRQSLQLKFDSDLGDAKEQYEKEAESFRNMEIKDFYRGNTGRRIIAGISVALGALGSALTGGRNQALDIINKAVDDDFNKQRAAILKQKDVMDRAGRMTEQLQQAFDKSLLRLQNRRIAGLEAIKAKTDEQIAKLGPQRAGLAAQQLSQELDQKILAEKQDFESGVRTNVQQTFVTGGPAQQKLTEQQVKKQQAAQEGRLAEQQYQAAFKAGIEAGENPTAIFEFIDNYGWAPDIIKSNERVTIANAERAWVETNLRDASGAAIGVNEREQYAKTYFPRPGDSQQTIANKEALRRLKMEVNERVGGATPTVVAPSRQQNQQPTAPTGQNEEKRQTADGRVAVFDMRTKRFLRYDD